MKQFAFWIIERQISDINQFLIENLEESIINLTLNPDAKDQSSMVAILLRGYAKEIGIQSNYGGIRNPAVVLHNKIRHDLTNYDQLRDKLTYKTKSRKISLCESFQVRKELVLKFFNLGGTIISQLPKEIKVPSAVILQRELLIVNTNYKNKELNFITQEESNNRCEDITGTNKYVPTNRPVHSFK